MGQTITDGDGVLGSETRGGIMPSADENDETDASEETVVDEIEITDCGLLRIEIEAEGLEDARED